MAVKKLSNRKTPLLITDIWIHVVCLECKNGYRVRMKQAQGRKNCPLCSDGSFFFTIEPGRGNISVTVEFLGKDFQRVEYPLSSEAIEIDEGE